MFNMLNTLETYNDYIDLHGQIVKESKEIVRLRLLDIEDGVKKGIIVPNYGDGKNHVFKIICGAGNHSVGGIGKLKVEIKRFLEQNDYDIHS